MATYNTLTSLLTAIANAIRTKTGDSAAINAQDFPSKITGISTASGNLLINHYSNVKPNNNINETVVNINLEKGNYNLTAIVQCYSFSNNNSATLKALLNNTTLLQINSNGNVATNTKQFQVDNTATFKIDVTASGDNNKYFYFDSVLTKII